VGDRKNGPSDDELTEDLSTLNHIVGTLNRAVDVSGALGSALARLVELVGLRTGWIFVKASVVERRGTDGAYVLTAHHDLPPALQHAGVWTGDCRCQRLCDLGSLREPYNEVHCSRLAGARGDRRELAVHASVPLRSGERVLGILNVAGPDWASFSPRALALLANVGNHMGVALERARLFDLLKERRVEEQSALLDLSNQLLGRLDLDDVADSVVEGTRRLLDADACALLLPDEDAGCVVFRAASGWRSDPVAEGRSSPLLAGGTEGGPSSPLPAGGTEGGLSIYGDQCKGPGMVMGTRQPVLVEDLDAGDSGAQGPAWLRAEGFRGHAVLPLLAGGRSIGALMVDMRRPRLLNEDEVRFLRLMANQAAIAIETARLHGEEVERQRLERELALGQQIQLALLPKESPVVPGWQVASLYRAARQVGGDFYDFFDLPGEPGRLGLVIADVADKGVPAALMMALSRTMIRTAALGGRGPSSALARANELILNDSRTGLFVTAFYAALDVHTGRLAYANAGHNRPLWLRAGTGEIVELAAHGIALGVLEQVELEERVVDVSPGDVLAFYTDGVTEAMDADGQLFGVERLRAAVAADPDASAAEIVSAVERALGAFTDDAPQSDDVALFVVRRRAAS